MHQLFLNLIVILAFDFGFDVCKAESVNARYDTVSGNVNVRYERVSGKSGGWDGSCCRFQMKAPASHTTCG